MAGDGVKTDRRARSQRNKIANTLTALSGIAITIEQQMPMVTQGKAMVAGQVLAGMAVMVNQFWPK